MKERLADEESVGDVFIGTIHSFANRVMKLQGDDYKIYCEDIDNDYHRELISNHLLFNSFWKLKPFITSFEKALSLFQLLFLLSFYGMQVRTYTEHYLARKCQRQQRSVK